MITTAARERFLTLYDAHVERVYRYHLARACSREDAEDLTAETFQAALESLHRLRADDPPLPWLFGIARHKLADWQRRRLFRGQARAAPLESQPDLPLPGPSTEEQAALRVEFSRAVGALRGIEPARAEAVTLHYVAGLSMAEVAQVLGKSESAARKLAERGLNDLRAKLERV
jgi:RNA polymerase sigma-70 factor (ECF subfamily)